MDGVDRRAVIGLTIGLLGLALGSRRRSLARVALAVIAGAIALVAGVAIARLVGRLRNANATGRRARGQGRRAGRARSRRSPRPAPTSRPSWPAASSSPPCAATPAATPSPTAATGLFSEGYFTVALDARIAAARRQLEPVAVVLIEVIEGLESGLPRPANPKAVAECITATIREADTACRLLDGGYALVLEDTAENGAIWTVERIRRRITDRGPGAHHVGRRRLLPGARLHHRRDPRPGRPCPGHGPGVAPGPHRGRHQ